MQHLLLASVVLVAGCVAARAGDRPTGDPVLVELFTSQGCSSCPPADALLRELGNDKRIIPLSFHVDYWNRLGWKDPFSAEAWSDRQGEYARALGRDGVYTPQVVVGGASETVGSSRSKVLGLVGNAPPSAVRVDVTGVIEAGSLRVRVSSSPPPGAAVLVAITESNLATDVPRGENAGRRMVNDHVVRHLAELPAGGELAVPLARNWNPSQLAAVAFVQDRRTRRVLGVARSPVK